MNLHICTFFFSKQVWRSKYKSVTQYSDRIVRQNAIVTFSSIGPLRLRLAFVAARFWPLSRVSIRVTDNGNGLIWTVDYRLWSRAPLSYDVVLTDGVQYLLPTVCLCLDYLERECLMFWQVCTGKWRCFGFVDWLRKFTNIRMLERKLSSWLFRNLLILRWALLWLAFQDYQTCNLSVV